MGTFSMCNYDDISVTCCNKQKTWTFKYFYHRFSIISGNKEDIQNFKNEIEKEIDNIKGHADERIETRYNSLKQIIQKQMIHEVVESIQPITIDGRPWNKTLGLPPLRGSYKSKALAHDLKSLGYKKGKFFYTW